MPTVAAILEGLEAFAPSSLAAEWDNTGLLLGDRGDPVERVMTCLTLTPDSAKEAVAAGVGLIVTHHPILFRGVKKLTTATSEGRMILSLARASVAVYCPHTAFDNTHGGINDMLARRLGLAHVVPLRRAPEMGSFKIVVFVPESDLARVSDAMFTAGAGIIGNYNECSYRVSGIGTFFGGEGSNPTLGQKGRREEVQEWRLEVLCPERALESVLAAMRRAHSYEEPAFDVYPLKPTPAKTGEGRIGSLPEPKPLRTVAEELKASLKIPTIQVVGTLERPVQRVAIVCGAGGEFLNDALRARADAFLTGEMRFHDMLRAQTENIGVLLPGHYASERFAVEELTDRLKNQWPGLSIWASTQERDPLTTL